MVHNDDEKPPHRPQGARGGGHGLAARPARRGRQGPPRGRRAREDALLLLLGRGNPRDHVARELLHKPRPSRPLCRTGFKHTLRVSSWDQALVSYQAYHMSCASTQAHAELNLRHQVRGRGYADAAAEARAVWNKALRRVDVQDAGPRSAGTARRLEVFYTGLYRALLARVLPRILVLLPLPLPSLISRPASCTAIWVREVRPCFARACSQARCCSRGASTSRTGRRAAARRASTAPRTRITTCDPSRDETGPDFVPGLPHGVTRSRRRASTAPRITRTVASSKASPRMPEIPRSECARARASRMFCYRMKTCGESTPALRPPRCPRAPARTRACA